MKILYIIPVRGGSKGIPKKNIKPLAGKPLVFYSLDLAFDLAKKQDATICLSTDSDEIIKLVEKTYNYKISFKRPDELATDTIGTHEVLIHALEFYESQGKQFDAVVLLQATSPFRKTTHVEAALKLYHSDLDMVVSVVKSHTNPYYDLFEEDENKYLKKSKKGYFTRRQDCPQVFGFNGAIYVINPNSLKKMPFLKFQRIKKYEMTDLESLDLDTQLDWDFAEFLIQEKQISL